MLLHTENPPAFSLYDPLEHNTFLVNPFFRCKWNVRFEVLWKIKKTVEISDWEVLAKKLAGY